MKRHIVIITAMVGISLALILFSYWRPAHQSPASNTMQQSETELLTHITASRSLRQPEPIYQHREQEKATEFNSNEMASTDAIIPDEVPDLKKDDSSHREIKAERAKRLRNKMRAIKAEFNTVSEERAKVFSELTALHETRTMTPPPEEILSQYFENPETLSPRVVKLIRKYLEQREEAARIKIRLEEVTAKMRELNDKLDRLDTQLSETRKEYRAALVDK